MGADPRSIVAYVNNTNGWFGSYSTVTVCPPFYGSGSLAEAEKNARAAPSGKLNMQFLQTKGLLMSHEMMHVKKITENRPHRKHSTVSIATVYS